MRRRKEIPYEPDKKTKKGWIIAVIAVAAAYLVFVNFLLSAALIPKFMMKLEFVDRIFERSIGELVSTSAVDNQLNRTADQTSIWLDSVTHETLTKTSEDGYQLIAEIFYPDRDLAWEMWTEHNLAAFPPKDSFDETYDHYAHTWVLLLHGFTGCKEEMYPYACWFHSLGCHVITPDMRCQGGSEGDFIGMGLTDSQDNMLWINEILARDPQAKIIIKGQSMGSACALMMSGRDDLPSNVVGIVSDCAYTDAYTMFGNRLEAWFHLPKETVIPAANLMLQLRGGYNLKDASALEAVRNNTIPKIFFHGDQDQMIPVEMAYELYNASQGEKELYIVEGAGHAQSSVIDPNLFWSVILDSMERWTE